jgi:hypothetical protein
MKIKLLLTFIVLLASTGPVLPAKPPFEGAKPLPQASSRLLFGQAGPVNDDKLYVSDQIDVSNIYPNPANEQTSFDYVLLNPSLNAKITIRNVLGGMMGEFLLDRNERNLNISVAHYVPGVYFYTLTIDNKNIVTKKLIIKR